MGIKEVQDFLTKAKTFYVATVENDEPRVRPFGVSVVYGGKLYFSTGTQKDFWRQVTKNPLIEICAFDGETEWLRLCGEAVARNDDEIKREFLKQHEQLKDIYADPNNRVIFFYLKNAVAKYYSFTSDVKFVKL